MKKETIKKKLAEAKEKTIDFVEEHGDKICTGIAIGAGALVSGFMFYCAGHAKGYDCGKHDENLDFVHLWTTKNVLSVTTVTDTDTGLVEAMMTKDFEKLMRKNCDIVEHDDGSWDFKSETES